MRAQRVVDLMSGQNTWFDSWVYRANAPFGHALHWTRPVDVILVVLSWPFTLFRSLQEAVFVGAFVFGLLMIVGIFLAVAWTARAFMDRGASYLAGAATAFQLGLVSYNAPRSSRSSRDDLAAFGTPDWLDYCGCCRPKAQTLAIRAGVVAALGLWVATEFLLPLAICLVALVTKWIVTGDRLKVAPNSHRVFGMFVAGGCRP